MESLPEEILEIIMSYGSHLDLLRFRCVCTQWKRIADRSGLWKNITYNPSCYDSEEKMINIIRASSPMLQSFKIDHICDERVLLPLLKCPNLKVLHITAPHQPLSLELFKMLVRACPEIEVLKAPDIILGHRRFSELVGKLTELKSLSCPGDQRTNLIFLKPIADNCKKLERLIFGNINYLMSDLKYFFLKTKDRLKTLKISCSNMNEDCILPELVKCKPTALKKLKLIKVSDCCYQFRSQELGKLKTVTCLSIVGAADVKVPELKSFFLNRNMEQLQELSLKYVDQCDDTVTEVIVENCPLIQKLQFKWCPYLTKQTSKYLERLQFLREVIEI